MWKEIYQDWLDEKSLDPALKQDLEGKSDKELEDMFYTDLEFGTGGMRGVLGAGTNRMNIYTIRRANTGLARYLEERYGRKNLSRGVAIAHDNRQMSKEFALESAKVLGYHGIKCYLFEDLRPTPELSYATRYLNAIAGIVVTASHNPPQYNGYKIYDEYGCQYTPEYANRIISLVRDVKDLFHIGFMTEEELKKSGLLEYIGKKIDDSYLEMVKTVQIHKELEKPLKIVFTPLHGTSAELGTRLLSECGYDIYPVREQMVHDPMFGTVKSPNPENPAAFDMAKKLGMVVGADLLIATDPDADRLGIAVKKDNDYILMTGNQTGAVLLNYFLSEKQKLGLLPKKGVVYNTIVTSDLGAKVARFFGMEVFSTLTGFKFIGEQARFLESTDKKFVFGYEESYGYVANDKVRDKDSLQAMLLASEAATYYNELEKKTLYDKLEDLFKIYGYHYEAMMNIEETGIEGKQKIARIMGFMQKYRETSFAGFRVDAIEDYKAGIGYKQNENYALTLPEADVVKYIFSDGSWFVFRPSGTEPKLKIYIASVGKTAIEAKEKIEKLESAIRELLEGIR